MSRDALTVAVAAGVAVASFAYFISRRRKSNSTDSARENCFTLVLTGGPCGGKTSCLRVLTKALTARGYNVFCAPEVPTIFLSNGGEYPGQGVSFEEKCRQCTEAVVSSVAQKFA